MVIKRNLKQTSPGSELCSVCEQVNKAVLIKRVCLSFLSAVAKPSTRPMRSMSCQWEILMSEYSLVRMQMKKLELSQGA